MQVNRTFSTKCIYALRAILELAINEGFGVIKSQQIAFAQDIPLRFLEIILAELRQGGFVDSRRGRSGGFVLARPSQTITVAQVIDFIEGHNSLKQRRLTINDGENPFRDLWEKLDRACSDILASTNFSKFAEQEAQKRNQRVLNYVI